MSNTTRAHQPLFTHGQTVTVAAAHERAYPRRARGGALGVISDVGRLVNGVRRYSVRFEAYWGAPGSSALPLRIPEDHLRAVKPPVTVERPAVGCGATCDTCGHHDWQTFGSDSRYRLCRKCKQTERVPEREGATR